MSSPKRAALGTVLACLALLTAGATALHQTRLRAAEEWRAVGAAWRGWANQAAPGRLRVKAVAPSSAGHVWRGLEASTLWPGHTVGDEGSWLRGEREVAWDQGNGALRMTVRQERSGLDVRTEVAFSGGDPPLALVQALGNTGIAVVKRL